MCKLSVATSGFIGLTLFFWAASPFPATDLLFVHGARDAVRFCPYLLSGHYASVCAQLINARLCTLIAFSVVDLWQESRGLFSAGRGEG